MKTELINLKQNERITVFYSTLHYFLSKFIYKYILNILENTYILKFNFFFKTFALLHALPINKINQKINQK